LTPGISARTRSGDPIPAMVLSAELNWMFASDGDRTRWTGFELDACFTLATWSRPDWPSSGHPGCISFGDAVSIDEKLRK
jgi:hypothetical protein